MHLQMFFFFSFFVCFTIIVINVDLLASCLDLVVLDQNTNATV